LYQHLNPRDHEEALKLEEVELKTLEKPGIPTHGRHKISFDD
jgi:hypothetical protein